MIIRHASTFLVIGLVLSGCGGGEEAQTTNARSVTPDGEVAQLNSDDTDIAQMAVEVLAEDLNIPIANIEVDTVRSVDWRDASIGCPQPDRSYPQVITPGHKITLRVDDTFHYVHEANGRAFVCKRSKSVTTVTPQFELVWGEQALAARQDLAAKLGVDVSDVQFSGVQGWTWRDASLGCPEPGTDYEKRTIEGYKLRLRHAGRDYSYHTDLDRLIACPPITED